MANRTVAALLLLCLVASAAARSLHEAPGCKGTWQGCDSDEECCSGLCKRFAAGRYACHAHARRSLAEADEVSAGRGSTRQGLVWVRWASVAAAGAFAAAPALKLALHQENMLACR